MTEHRPEKIGISQVFPCSYLASEKERLLVVLDNKFYNPEGFEHLLSLGFRRSNDQIYRPHCPHCNACEAIRLDVNDFKPSKSQKRVLNKSRDFKVSVSNYSKHMYYSLYERYINMRHSDGAMHPATYEQYKSFLTCSWLHISYLELWHCNKLIAVAVTDTLENSTSAIYTFFNPDYAQFSLGTLMILKQIEYTKQLGKQFLYLGYQINECQKMNYKTNFSPFQKLNDNIWLIEP